MTLEKVQDALMKCYSKDLCYPKVRNEWEENNKCFGMCAITALIINDYFCGEICKIYVGTISHYFNLIDGKIIDLTSSQFNENVDYTNYQIVDRNLMLNEDTKIRYNSLKKKIKEYL